MCVIIAAAISSATADMTANTTTFDIIAAAAASARRARDPFVQLVTRVGGEGERNEGGGGDMVVHVLDLHHRQQQQ